MIVLLAAVTLLHRLWLPPIGGFLIVADPLQAADAVVPLAGDPARISGAARLWQQGSARWFVATSMPDPSERYGERVKRAALRMGVAAQAIVVPAAIAYTTYGEAQILRDLAVAQGWRSLLIVTSPSHTRRARMIFRAIFAESGIAITVRPVEPHWYTPQTWWQRWDGVRETGREYVKLALYLIGYHAVTTNRR